MLHCSFLVLCNSIYSYIHAFRNFDSDNVKIVREIQLTHDYILSEKYIRCR